ncbi:hypothetical protein [Streptomyces sp. NPDC004296]|uniref:hypothetical protein n=1 Tax=Streptomyces sp. NPDC004296 TaxID=3364697 RepID=UPI00367AEAB1
MFTIAVAWHYQLSPERFVLTVAGSVLHFWLYLYNFCLTNQLTGRLEDRVNKPFRPIQLGRVFGCDQSVGLAPAVGGDPVSHYV